MAMLIALIGGTAAIVFLKPKSEVPRSTPTRAAKPTLYCEFYNFMHSGVVVSFDFVVSREEAAPLAFAQAFVVEPDGTKTDYSDSSPRWELGSDDGTPVLTSPDAQTRILLYGFKKGASGVFWIEAGIRSNAYRNLEGKCRQAHLDLVAAKS